MSEKQAFSFILSIISDLHNKGMSSEYMKAYKKALRSWLSHNGKQVTQKIRIPDGKKTTKVQDEQPPTAEQVRRVLNAADLKQRVECTLIGFAVLRPETLGEYKSGDGLKVSSIKFFKGRILTISFVKPTTHHFSLCRAGLVEPRFHHKIRIFFQSV